MSEKFDIFFSGQIIAGQDEAAVRAKLERAFNANPKQLEQLFSGQPVKIKSGVDIEKAAKYRVSFRNAGALIDIKPVTTTAQPPASTPPAKDKIELLPAKTGSLIDCAPQVVPAKIPNIDGITLGSSTAPLDSREPAPPANIDTEGLTLNPPHSETTLDERKPSPAAEIDTTGLTLNTANTGSLEDCQQPVEAAKIPDISALEIVEPKVTF
ncbi:MAG: hypothetical protein L3J26_03255 [Candidatus Polarisedimenticolaceae bacterium]|nr:hypothetical protein [Candidatus Polarisedimenticolaceae bacterium]